MTYRFPLPLLILLAFGFSFLSAFSAFGSAPETFSQAKIILKEQIYFDQNQNGSMGTIYCGCNWQWVGRSGGIVDHKRCGYEIRAIPSRGERTEIEHVVPASWLGQQRQCWQKGGRKNCNRTDSTFNRMEADLHNMTVSVGELNADRSNYRFGELPNARKQHGLCESKVDFKKRVFEPRDKAKGIAARINFYMYDRYNLKMSDQQQRLFIAWNKQFPVTDWELERDRRITRVMGHNNEFVTGKRSWKIGHKNSKDGVIDSRKMTVADARSITAKAANDSGFIHGNRNSKIYHLPHCPSYKAMKQKNMVKFKTENQAQSSGYRRAKNCP